MIVHTNVVNKNSLAYKVIRAIPGIFIWTNLVAAILLAIFSPYHFFLLSFPNALHNLWVVASVAWFALKAIGIITKATQADHYKEYKDQVKEMKNAPHAPLVWEDIIHYVIVPNYKEHVATMQEMINTISASKLAKNQIILCLAMEAREGQAAVQRAEDLIKANKPFFKDVIYTAHPKDLPDELPGKSSNEAWAAQKVAEHVLQNGFPREKVLITIADADSLFHPKHFDMVTSKFCLDSDRYNKIFQGPMVCYKNFDTVPACTRIMSMIVSLHEVACIADTKDIHIPFSTYSLSLNMAIKVGGWDTDVIPEDWHMFLKSYFATGGKTVVEGIALPVFCYAVEADGQWESIKARYVQAQRHAYGVTEIVYYFYKLYETFILGVGKKPPVLKSLKLMWKICSVQYLGAMSLPYMALSYALIFAYSYIPGLANSEIAPQVVGAWSAPFRYCSMLNLPGVALSLLANYHLVNMAFGKGQVALYTMGIWLLEWLIAMPPTNFFMCCIPFFQAATKLMKTEKFQYIVAAKPVDASQAALQASPTSPYYPHHNDSKKDQ